MSIEKQLMSEIKNLQDRLKRYESFKSRGFTTEICPSTRAIYHDWSEEIIMEHNGHSITTSRTCMKCGINVEYTYKLDSDMTVLTDEFSEFRDTQEEEE